MDFSIYPFKRYGKFRLYVRFLDPFDNEVIRSTGIGYEFDATEKEKKEAKKQAEKRGKQIMQEYFNEYDHASREPEKNPRLSNFLKEDFWPNKEISCAKSTVTRYKSNLKNFLRICKDRPMDAYKRIDMERYKQTRLKEGIKKTTANIEMRSIKVAFSWAYKYDLTDNNPFKGQDFMFDAKQTKRAFTKEEVNTLLEITKDESFGLPIRLAYYTGMRQGEIRLLTWNYVYLEENPHLHIPEDISKTGSARKVPLVGKAYEVVKKMEQKLEAKKKRLPAVYKDRPQEETFLLQKDRGWGSYSARTVQERFRKYMRKADLPEELTFHCLRHSFATHVLSNNGDLYAVSKIMGHSTTMVTQQFYDHTSGLNFRGTMERI